MFKFKFKLKFLLSEIHLVEGEKKKSKYTHTERPIMVYNGAVFEIAYYIRSTYWFGQNIVLYEVCK